MFNFGVDNARVGIFGALLIFLKEIVITIIIPVEVVRFTTLMVKDYAVIKQAHFNIWKVNIVYGGVWQILPISYGIVGNVSTAPPIYLCFLLYNRSPPMRDLTTSSGSFVLNCSSATRATPFLTVIIVSGSKPIKENSALPPFPIDSKRKA